MPTTIFSPPPATNVTPGSVGIAPSTALGSCVQCHRRFNDEYTARTVAVDAAHMNMVKLQRFQIDRASEGGVDAHVCYCGDPDLVRAAVEAFQAY